MKLGLIVEGHGEVAALPILLRRISSELGQRTPEIVQPLRLPKGKIQKESELARAVELMARKTAPDGGILVLLDADDDCPAVWGPRLLGWARKARADRGISIVLAHVEFETWFLHAASSLRGKRGLAEDLISPPDPEKVRDPKGWLAQRLPNGYSETVDQPALAALFNWQLAEASPSFSKLLRDLKRLLG